VEDVSLEAEDPALYARGLTARRKAREAARAKLWDMQDPGLSEGTEIVVLDGKPHIYHVWGKDNAADRRHLRRYIDSVTLDKTQPGRRAISERVTIRWKDGTRP
jgi:hypothetical protein